LGSSRAAPTPSFVSIEESILPQSHLQERNNSFCIRKSSHQHISIKISNDWSENLHYFSPPNPYVLMAKNQHNCGRITDHDGLVFTKEELAALAGAIKDPAVKEVIDTETLGPVDEREKICAFLQTHAPLGRLAQQSFCQDVVDLWLFEEHILEGRNSAFSSRSDRRSKDIEKLRPKRDATVIEQASQTNAIATSSTQAHQNGELTLSVSAFFKPLALMKGMANACKGPD
jgi:hypothetical protein